MVLSSSLNLTETLPADLKFFLYAEINAASKASSKISLSIPFSFSIYCISSNNSLFTTLPLSIITLPLIWLLQFYQMGYLLVLSYASICIQSSLYRFEKTLIHLHIFYRLQHEHIRKQKYYH